jgi:hypothetical protein
VGGSALAQEAGGVPARARGRRPSPFSQGWTSQPGKFVDDVSLPEGFTYDVVASYRDRIGGGEPFGYIDPARASDPVPGLVVVPFKGYEFPRPDFVGEAELHLAGDKVTKVVFRAP